MAESAVVLKGLSRVFPAGQRGGAHAALSDLSLDVATGEFVALIGPSGCGKSTTLRLVAGLDEPDAGTVSIGGRDMKGVPPQDRDVAMVFQSYALYPQMTVREILEFPLKMRKTPSAERERAVSEAASMLSLEKLLTRRPDQLSGGERQRVAMGRAIVRHPRVFLFDEPLANLDPSLREDIRQEIVSLVRRLGATALYVTHDHAEAMTMADRVAVLRNGTLLQCSLPREIYERPGTEFVGTFVGAPKMNVLPAEVIEGRVHSGLFDLPLPSGDIPKKIHVGIRPEDIRVGASGVSGEVLAVEPLGAETHLLVSVGDAKLRVRESGFSSAKRGEKISVELERAKLHFFDPAQDGRRVESAA